MTGRKIQLSLEEIASWIHDANWMLLWFIAGAIAAGIFKIIYGTKEDSKAVLCLTIFIFPPLIVIPVLATILWLNQGKWQQKDESEYF